MKRESLRDPRRVQEIEALRKPGRARDRDWDVSDTLRQEAADVPEAGAETWT